MLWQRLRHGLAAEVAVEGVYSNHGIEENQEGRTSALINLLRGRFEIGLSGVQLAEQDLRLLQIERVEAFSEPAVDRSEKFAGLISLALV